MAKKISRRSFIQQTAKITSVLSLPYFIPAKVLGRAGSVPPSERIGMGFIGLGGQGIGNMSGGDFSHIPGGFLGKPEVQAIAVCDVDRNRRQKAESIVDGYYGNKDCTVYKDFRELLARDDIDAVMIATPDHWHALIGVAAAKAGKDVYCEKPLAHNIREGRAICETVQKYGTVWQTGCQQRSWREFRTACELVQNGFIGEVRTVRVSLPAGRKDNIPIQPIPVPDGFDYDFWLGPAPWAPYCKGRCHGSFRNNSDYSSGAIADWAGHHVDIAQWGMGADNLWPAEIEAEGVFLSGGLYDNMVTYRIECRYEEGFTMIIEDSANREKGRNGLKFTPGCFGENIGIFFEGSEGWIQVNRGGLDIFPQSVLKKSRGRFEKRLYRSDDHKQNFLDCIKIRKKTVATAASSFHSIAIGYMGVISMKLKRRLRWDGLNEEFVNDDEANRMLYREMRSPWYI